MSPPVIEGKTPREVFPDALVGAFTQTSVIPSAAEYIEHYDHCFDTVDDIQVHMAQLVDDARSAIGETAQMLGKRLRDAVAKVPSKIAAKIGRIPEQHFSLAFDAIQRAGLKAFCPDIVGPVQSTYNQIHRHLAITTLQTAVKIFGLHGLEVDIRLVNKYGLLADVYENYVYGRLAQITTRTERNKPQSLLASTKTQAAVRRRRVRCGQVYNMAKRLGYRNAVLRGLRSPEMHSDDKTGPALRTDHKKQSDHCTALSSVAMPRHLYVLQVLCDVWGEEIENAELQQNSSV
ncbi:hypothetical protein C8F01DRAFT_1075431 [Mycena amicta]|nr:hypothetical protein C8F01DRAFT_1075431 [Mycena amicta]